ncbi:MAG TPA: hypothetical protein VHV08_06235 [Pirellulales bacterium]|nr:hypothetical protein [Pirellulales bacterium]
MNLARTIGFLAAAALLVAVASGLLAAGRLWACPFCSAVSLTFSEEINNSQVAVIATLVSAPKRAAAAVNSLDVAKSKFEIVQVLKGHEALGKNRTIDAVYFGDGKPGTKFLIMGIDPPNINWSTPILLSDRGQTYVAKAIELPKEGADRLAFFQDYLEDSDEMLARDAYDEFAKTPYAGVQQLKDRIKHDKIVEWIKSPQIPVSRRRLYLTMLGVCGTKDDVAVLEEMIRSKDRQTKGALDALVAAYLTLKGPDGMPLIEELFLKNKDAEYTDTYAAIMALRFHGTEEKIVPRARLLAGLRTMLDRPQLADLVIPDLARWEDWSVVDRLVDLFKNADEESSWVRVPVINYLRACPLPAAKERIDELAKLDPETVKRANSFFPLTNAAPPAAADNANAASAKPAESKPDEAATKPAQAAPAAGSAAPASPTTPVPPTVEPSAPAATAADPAVKPAASPAQPATSAVPVEARPPGTLAESLSKDAVAPPALPESNLPVMAGLGAAAILLGCAFWAILRGGGQAANS